MQCYYCERDIHFIIPLRGNFPGGRLVAFSCLGCAEKSGRYCIRHEKAHDEFGEGEGTACRTCVDEEIERNLHRGEEIVRLITELVPIKELEFLVVQIEEISELTGQLEGMWILRWIITKAHYMKISLDDVVELIRTVRSLSPILDP